MSESPAYTYLQIGLPLPLPVVSALGDMVSKAWPDAAIITDPVGAGVPAEYHSRTPQLLIRLDTSKAPKRVTKETASAAALQAAGDPDGFAELATISADGAMNVRTSEEVRRHIGESLAVAMLDAGPNYVEWQMELPSTGERLVLVAARSPKQTPHELRMAAEARLDRIRDLIAGRRSNWSVEVASINAILND